jgi:hypothetical protein
VNQDVWKMNRDIRESSGGKSMEKPQITTYCGLDCDSCEYKASSGCGGCVATKGKPFHGHCDVAECAVSKGKQFCGDCESFPCATLKSYSFDPEHGDNGARLDNCSKIKAGLVAAARDGLDPIAYCGFSCNHCFLGQWCGSCRSDYNFCSYATISEDGICPNVRCCKERGQDGCYECSDLSTCTIGFYIPDNDGAQACKAQAMFVGKYGKAEFLKAHDRLHVLYPDFKKTQEILNGSAEEGLELLEKCRQ